MGLTRWSRSMMSMATSVRSLCSESSGNGRLNKAQFRVCELGLRWNQNEEIVFVTERTILSVVPVCCRTCCREGLTTDDKMVFNDKTDVLTNYIY